jgi:hypothetical protein
VLSYLSQNKLTDFKFKVNLISTLAPSQGVTR